MEFVKLLKKIEKLNAIIYKLVRDREINEKERKVIDNIVEEKDYNY